MSTPEKRVPFIQALIAKHNIPNSEERRRYQSVLTVLYADELAEANALNRAELQKLAEELRMKVAEQEAAFLKAATDLAADTLPPRDSIGTILWECSDCREEETTAGNNMPKAYRPGGHVHHWRRKA